MKNKISEIDRNIRRRVQFWSVIMAASVAAAFFLVIQPEYGRASVATAEMDRLERESGSIIATESMLQELEVERIHRLSIEREQLETIPTSASESRLTDALALKVDDGAATSWSVRLLPVEEIQVPDETKQFKSLPMAVEMRGRFAAVLDALQRVESSDRLVRLRSLRVTRSRNESQMVEANFELDTVFATEVTE
jgi:Tfp pilus assembly protein PilO